MRSDLRQCAGHSLSDPATFQLDGPERQRFRVAPLQGIGVALPALLAPRRAEEDCDPCADKRKAGDAAQREADHASLLRYPPGFRACRTFRP